jgi:hypothetical protein
MLVQLIKICRSDCVTNIAISVLFQVLSTYLEVRQADYAVSVLHVKKSLSQVCKFKVFGIVGK